eukprot:CAMPEP_0184502616 /NCGR_PEP_ID=MMETSP0113_2-20130426/50858_1 /TAXON_ID=91329 /ORGANISM="Norrisiella sphaerica, Strain BC52" /LENGTH=182 /DNA_ID=CAMNT_0026891883 /DNA_START=126 /DNA_END=674 /DNA_ORIENTATION=+
MLGKAEAKGGVGVKGTREAEVKRKNKNKPTLADSARSDEIMETFSEFARKGKLAAEDIGEALSVLNMQLTEKGAKTFKDRAVSFKEFKKMLTNPSISEKIVPKYEKRQQEIRDAFASADKHHFLPDLMKPKVLEGLVARFTMYKNEVAEIVDEAPDGKEGYKHYGEILNMLLVEALREELQM